MRIALAVLVVLCVAAPASADSKVAGLVKFYKKEAMVCAKYSAGLQTAVDRAKPFVDEDKDIAADVALIHDAHVVVLDYCDSIDAMLQLLTVDPKATYKQLAKEIDEHDAIVRSGRKASLQAIDDTNPVIQRLIPKINKRIANS
jgi:hypothetical protein